MSLNNLNWLAILVSTIALIFLGSVWFSPKALYPIWWKAMNRTPEEVPVGSVGMGIVFGSTFVAAFIQVLTLSVVIHSLAKAPSVAIGIGAGFTVGIGFAAATSVSHRLFGGQGFKVWLLESAPDLINLMVVGAIIGAWN